MWRLALSLVVLSGACAAPGPSPQELRVEAERAERVRAEEERQRAEAARRDAQERERARAARAIDRAFVEYITEQRRLGQREGWWSSWMGGACAPARAPDAWARTLHRANTDPTLTEQPRRVRVSVWGRGPIIQSGRDTGEEWAVILLEGLDAPGGRRAFLISTDPHFCAAQMARERRGLPFDVPGGTTLPITF
jgi:hypothetical protein